MRILSLCSVVLGAALSLCHVTSADTVAVATPADAIGVPGAPELSEADLEAWCDGFFPYALRQTDVAGVVIAVVKNGHVLFEKGYGDADIAHQVPMDPGQTEFLAASVSKTFTWTAVMQLVQAHKIDLNADINTYLDFRIPAAFGKPITMQDLMTHTAGFEELLETYHSKGKTDMPLARYMQTVPPPTRIFPPGSVVAYSNYGANLAGYIVQRVSGQSFADYVEQHILAPLGMSHSTFRRPLPRYIAAALAKSYDMASSGTPLPADLNEEGPREWPAGGLVSTADDMTRFALAQLQGGGLGGAQILDPGTARQMQTTAFVPMPGAQGIALGLFHQDRNGHEVIGHYGDDAGFHTDLELMPQEGVGYFMAVNSDGWGSLLSSAFLLRSEFFRGFMDRYFPGKRPGPRLPTAPTAVRDARIVSGEYQMSRRSDDNWADMIYLTLQVPIAANPDGTIETPGWLNIGTFRPQRWREVGSFQWEEVGGTARLNMEVVQGKVREWWPGNVQSAYVMQPVSFWRSQRLIYPLLLYICAVLFLECIFWPIAAVVRRRYGRKLDLEKGAWTSLRLTRYGALVGAGFVLSFIALAGAMSANLVSPDAALDPWLRGIQAIGLILVAAALIASWNAWTTLLGRREWWSKVWSVLLATALVALSWFAFVFHIMSWKLNY